MLRIIHSSDVHLGKSFAFLDDETASLMREARFAARLGWANWQWSTMHRMYCEPETYSMPCK